jgi:type II secretory pathway component GspD/PulD (secretin)
LLVLITPHIITNLQEGAHITQEMKERTGLQESLPKRQVPGGAPATSGQRGAAPMPY